MGWIERQLDGDEEGVLGGQDDDHDVPSFLEGVFIWHNILQWYLIAADTPLSLFGVYDSCATIKLIPLFCFIFFLIEHGVRLSLWFDLLLFFFLLPAKLCQSLHTHVINNRFDKFILFLSTLVHGLKHYCRDKLELHRLHCFDVPKLLGCQL